VAFIHWTYNQSLLSSAHVIHSKFTYNLESLFGRHVGIINIQNTFHTDIDLDEQQSREESETLCVRREKLVLILI
jgi:hypothetical protein